MSLTTEQTNRFTYLKRLVALRVDEYTEGENVNLPSGDVGIELVNAARSIIKRASRTAVLPLAKKAASVTMNTKKTNSTILPLPADYVRFIQVQGKTWLQPVTGLIPADSRDYKNQTYEMLRATLETPMVFMVPWHSGDSNRALELFPQVEELDDQGLTYVPEVQPYDMPVEFEDALVWRATMAVLVILRSNNVNAVLTLSENAIAEISTEVAA